MHQVILAALEQLGVRGQLGLVAQPRAHGEVLCFQQHSPNDLAWQDAKIVGSAQRKHRGALLQHGGILLGASRHTPQLPGIRELTGLELSPPLVAEAITDALARDTGWRIYAADWSEDEWLAIARLRDERYVTAQWNAKR